jgi:hypothetical protein
VALATIALWFPLASRADSEAGTPSPFVDGEPLLGLQVGGGFGLPAFGTSKKGELRDTRVFGVFPRWGIGLSDTVARGTFYEGNWEFDVEPMVLLNYNPRFGWALGGTLFLHYNFTEAEHLGALVPFIEGGAGGAHLAFDLKGEADGFVFPLQASFGLHWLAFPKTALTGSIGYYHLSNAGTRYPNEGINMVSIKVGITTFPWLE